MAENERAMETFGQVMDYLDWPEEQAGDSSSAFSWFHAGSNICLDFHGDPASAQLVIFSDGNHHMALRDCLDLFLKRNEGLSSIFYATTPPGPIIGLLKAGRLQIGNLIINVFPHVFISPPDILNRLSSDRHVSQHIPFVRNQGNVLLVKKGNPKQISSVHDLMQDDVRLFLSNPETEKASYRAYYETLRSLAYEQEAVLDFPDHKINQGQVVFGKCIHHREAPQAVAEGSADAAMVFYHLALRYVRIFPGFFEMISLGGTMEKPDPYPGNVISRTHMALVGDGGLWGQKFLDFLGAEQAKAIYRYHGLLSL